MCFYNIDLWTLDHLLLSVTYKYGLQEPERINQARYLLALHVAKLVSIPGN